jgi:hypothetical protein
MKTLTAAEAAHIKARSFLAIVGLVERAADVLAPIGQRDQTRRHHPKGDAMMERRKARRRKLNAIDRRLTRLS